MKGLTAPYCAACAKKTRFIQHFVFTALLVVGLGLLVVMLPFFVNAVPIMLAIIMPPVLLGPVALAYCMSCETRRPRTTATTRQDAVRVLRLWPPSFFCSSRRFAERVVQTYGGNAAPWTQRQWDVAWSGVGAGGAVLGIVWIVLIVTQHSAIMIDNRGRAPNTIWLDGRRVAEIDAGDHEKIHLRTGKHTLAWSTGNTPAHERTVNLVPVHDYLYNPGTTACYWRSVQVYQQRGPSHDPPKEATDDGPLTPDELYDFPHVDRWFENNPTTKQLSKGQSYETDYAIVRDERCTDLLVTGCSTSAIDELIRCESTAKTATDVNACMATAHELCNASSRPLL